VSRRVRRPAKRAVLGHFPAGSRLAQAGQRPAEASCPQVRVWWATVGGTTSPVYVPCQVEGPHGQHQGPGGMRWL
jgi:hypothetical protein